MTTTTTIMLLLTTIPTMVFGQLKGKFCHHFGFESECITFLDSNKFEYSNAHCTGLNEGKGVYTIHDDNLILQFQTDTANNTKYKVSIQKVPMTNYDTVKIDPFERLFLISQKVPINYDTVTIEVNVFSLDSNKPLSGAYAFVKDDSGKSIDGAVTDFDGQCIFNIPATL